MSDYRKKSPSSGRGSGGAKSGAGRGAKPRNFSSDRAPRRSSDDRPRGDTSSRPRRAFDDKPKRDFGDRPRRDFGDKPSRPRSESSDRPRRSFDDRPKRDFGDRPKRDFSDKPKRDFGDRPRAPRGESSDRPRRDFGDKPSRPRNESSDRPRRSFDDRPKRDFSDRPKRDFSDKPKRDFGDRPRAPRGESSDRPRRDFGDRPRTERKTFTKKEIPAAGSGAIARKGHENVLYGVHAVVAALQNPQRTITKIYATESSQKHVEDFLDTARHPEITIVDRDAVDRYVPEGAVHQGIAILSEPLPETFLSDIISASRVPNPSRQVVVVLDEVTDPHNVGAIMRSMATFGARAMIVHKYNAPTVTGTIAKIATGAAEHIPMVVVTNLAATLEELQLAGFYVLGLDEKATVSLTAVPRDRSVALVLGAEGHGLRPKTRSVCDAIAAIPSLGPIASLNVSNAAAIALYEVTREG